MALRKVFIAVLLLLSQQSQAAPVYVTVEGVLDEIQGYDPGAFVLGTSYSLTFMLDRALDGYTLWADQSVTPANDIPAEDHFYTELISENLTGAVPGMEVSSILLDQKFDGYERTDDHKIYLSMGNQVDVHLLMSGNTVTDVPWVNFTYRMDGLPTVPSLRQMTIVYQGRQLPSVPLPPGVWLFGSALGILGWLRGRNTKLSPTFD
jgi:hypothetical protein